MTHGDNLNADLRLIAETVADLVQALTSPTSPQASVSQVRINEVLLALVRAKVVEKGVVKVRFFRLSFFVRRRRAWGFGAVPPEEREARWRKKGN